MSKQSAPPPGGYTPPQGSAPGVQAVRTPFGQVIGYTDAQGRPVNPYQQATEGQSQASQQAVGQQTQQNRPDQYGPTGSVTWGVGPDGRPTQKTSLDPSLEAALSSEFGQIRDSLGSSLDFSGLPTVSSGEDARKAAQNALYGQAKSRLDPQWDQREQQFESRMAAQGLAPGSEAYNNARQNFDRGRNDAYSSAENAAVTGGLQEQEGQFSMSTQARQNALAELLRKRETPLSEMSALLGAGRPQFESFYGAGQYQVPQYLQAAQLYNDYMLGKTDRDNQGSADFWSGLGKAAEGGAALASLSDERAKEDVHRLPIDAEPGIPLATFRYKGSPGKNLGVIAQDVAKVQPHNVARGKDGLLRVAPKFRPFSLSK